MANVLIVGGGLAGLTASILLARSGISVKLVEKKEYPYHKVCGEYVSNEVYPFMDHLGLLPPQRINSINNFTLTSTRGKSASVPLKMGGFGISRYQLDSFLFQKARKAGVNVVHDEVMSIRFDQIRNVFQLRLKNSGMEFVDFVIGAYGKRSRLDRKRGFFSKRSPWVGVKYHIKYDVPQNSISLHNFHQGYCGISRVESGISNLCYLSSRANLQKQGSIESMERNILSMNPHLKKIFMEAEFLFKDPLVINEISFATKSPIEDHMLMTGDSAGMIAPLCGNGMAMAIHSGKIAADLLMHYEVTPHFRKYIERDYRKKWRKQFAARLQVGRTLQSLFGKVGGSEILVGMIKATPDLASRLIELTHGNYLEPGDGAV